MSCLSVSELALAERRDIAIREAVRVTGKRLGVNYYDREVAVQCAVNAYRAGSSAAEAVARGTRYLRTVGGSARAEK